MWISLGGWSSIYDTKIECVFARQFDPGFLTHSQVSVAGCSPASIISKLISGPHDGWLMVDATSPVRPCKIVWWWSMYISMLDEFRWISPYFHISISIYFHIFPYISPHFRIFPYISISSSNNHFFHSQLLIGGPYIMNSGNATIGQQSQFCAEVRPKRQKRRSVDQTHVDPHDFFILFGWFLVDFWGWWWFGPLKKQKDLGLYKFFQYGWLGGG